MENAPQVVALERRGLHQELGRAHGGSCLGFDSGDLIVLTAYSNMHFNIFKLNYNLESAIKTGTIGFHRYAEACCT